MGTSYGSSSLPVPPVRVFAVAVSPPTCTRIQKQETAERKADSSSENSSGEKEKHEALQQQCQRKRTTSHNAVRQKRDPRKSRHRYESASCHGAQRGLRNPGPGMSPIAVRHFEHGSEASTRFTCALTYIYICICIPRSQRTTKTLCARAGSLARAALSGRSGKIPLPSPLRTLGAVLCSRKRQAPSHSKPRHLRQRWLQTQSRVLWETLNSQWG